MMDVVFSVLPAGLIAYGQSLGFERQALLDVSTLTEEQLSDPDAQVDLRSLILLWNHYIDHFPTKAMGLQFGRMMELENFGAFGLLILHSQTLRGFMDKLIRFQTILDPQFRISMDTREDIVVITFDHMPEVLALVEPMELFMCSTCQQGMAHVAGQPSLVTMRHTQKHSDEVYAMSFQCPVLFEQPTYTITVARNVLEEPIAGGDATVARYVTKYLETLLQESALPDVPTAASTSAKVTSWLSAHLSEGPTQHEMARALSMSERTLQRRLKGEGTTFSQLLKDVRQAQALHYLQHTTSPIYEIAFLLGYHDTASFYRAFRQWRGHTPDHVRKG